MDRKAQTDKVGRTTSLEEWTNYTQSWRKTTPKKRQDHLCVHGKKNDVCMLVHMYLWLVFIHTRQAGHKYICVHVWARRCHVVILSMVVAFAASVESSSLSSSLLEPRRDRGNWKRDGVFSVFCYCCKKRQNTDIRETSRQARERENLSIRL